MSDSNELARVRHLATAGRFEESQRVCQELLATNPQHVEALQLLARILCQLNRVAEAIEHLTEAVRRRPADPALHRELGELLFDANLPEQSMAHFEHAILLAPEDAEARHGAGVVLTSQNRHTEAISRFREALQLRPGYIEAEKNLGSCLRLVGQLDEAVIHLQRVIRRWPDCADAHLDLGCVCVEFGRFDEAIEHLEEALRLNAKLTAAYHNLAALSSQRKYKFSQQQLDAMAQLASAEGVHPHDDCVLNLALGGVLDRQGEYDVAFQHYCRGNNARQQLLIRVGKAFDVNAHGRAIDATSAVFGEEFFREFTGRGIESETPVFVIGMPRSGTTLVEQIIASHPNALGAGELQDIGRLANGLSQSLNSKADYPQCMTRADAATIRGLAQSYLQSVTDRVGHAERIVDKMWTNFFFLGFIWTLFPKARIVHCRRDAMDVCLSCYFCYFNSIHWAWDLEDIGFYFREYERLMDHWRKVLPLRVYEVAYEKLVSNQEEVSRDLIAFCGMDWDPQCETFYESARPVQTASCVQVRQPIYTSSIGRWKRYENHLTPLKQALENKS